MKIQVKIQRPEKIMKVEIPSKSNVKDLLKKININSTTIIVTRNKEVLDEDTMLNNKDKLELLSVISGG